MPPAIKAVIFDVDGTLIDSVDFHAQAWVDAFAHFGHDVGYFDIRKQIGKGGDKLMPVFLERAEIDKVGKKIEAFRASLFKRKFLEQVKPFSGVRALFQRLLRDDFKIALASSAKTDELAVYKRIAEIGDLLDTETSSDDAEESKPEPDIFEAAQSRLGKITAKSILVIGDTPYDAHAAVKAGMRCIGVLSGGFSARSLKSAGCVETYQSASEILVNYEKAFR